MSSHWPAGNRDTTKFPDVDIEIAADFREHLALFASLDGVPHDDYDKQRLVAGVTLSDQRLRTYRKMYERLGLVLRVDGMIRSSALGMQIARIKPQLEAERDGRLNTARQYAIHVLSKYQWLNPVDAYAAELPSDCDVQPFLATWIAMRSLDNRLHHEELERVLMRVMRMSDLTGAIERIRAARGAITDYRDATPSELERHLGPTVFSDQNEARAAALFSIAGWGGLIISLTQPDGFRHLRREAILMVDAVLAAPPRFYDTTSVDEWNRYYLAEVLPGDDSVEARPLTELAEMLSEALEDTGLVVSPVQSARFVASLMAKPFVIVTGLTGSGKTRLAQQFARWITPVTNSPYDYAVVPVGANWTSAEHLLGYPDALDSARYVRTPALDLILRAHENLVADEPTRPHFLILDEMNLSHVEKYLAPILSAVESGETIPLHSGPGHRDGVPPAVELPLNVYIAGTVNVDETTYMFSPKVLDRAHVLEFRVENDDLFDYAAAADVASCDISGLGLGFASGFVDHRANRPPLTPEMLRLLRLEVRVLFGVLAEFDSEFGFRTIKEAKTFMQAALALTGGLEDPTVAMDVIIVQKVLPRLFGSRKRLEPILAALAFLAFSDRSPIIDAPDDVAREQGTERLKRQALEVGSLKNPDTHPITGRAPLRDRSEQPYYPLSLDKSLRMLARVMRDGFASFAEA